MLLLSQASQRGTPVKVVEPHKQMTYPYNGRKTIAGQTQQLHPSETKSPWWPAGVSHREPDHLPKAERIRLLVHILCGLHASHGISAQKLKAADQPIRQQVSPPERLQILDEIYVVREEEEQFSEGITGADGKAAVSIFRANLPDTVEISGRHGESSQAGLPTEEVKHEKKQRNERFCNLGASSRAGYLPQASFTFGSDMFANMYPSLYPFFDTPMQYIEQDLSVHARHSFDPLTTSATQHDPKRRRQCVNTTSGHNIQPYQPPYLHEPRAVHAKRLWRASGLPAPGHFNHSAVHQRASE
ncbi:hypothetical protein N7451_012724 [Penicillium sp. IBT 35674x]|nr:hypothetical protein N7451_012724 [Penicillium sp. IBT 35674x]